MRQFQRGRVATLRLLLQRPQRDRHEVGGNGRVHRLRIVVRDPAKDFERRVPGDADNGDLRSLRRFRTTLPTSPMSYQGIIVRVRWCVRVRVFLRNGKDVSREAEFQLGRVPRATAVDSESPPP